jgi:hypothetical protein
VADANEHHLPIRLHMNKRILDFSHIRHLKTHSLHLQGRQWDADMSMFEN